MNRKTNFLNLKVTALKTKHGIKNSGQKRQGLSKKYKIESRKISLKNKFY